MLKRGAAEAATNVEGFDSQFGEVDVEKGELSKRGGGGKVPCINDAAPSAAQMITGK